jgi:hypothetical protein
MPRELLILLSMVYPGFFWWGSTNLVEDTGQRVRGSGGSCNWIQGILFHIVKFS